VVKHCETVIGVDLLDIVFAILVVLFAVSGYRQGFIVGICSFAGFIGGLLLGVWLVPISLRHVKPGLVASTVAICVVLALAVLGQIIATAAGSRLRDHVRGESAIALDRVAGAGVSIVSVLLVAWLVGLLLVGSALPTLSSQARHSAVLRAMSQILPSNAQNWFSSFSTLLNRDGFPSVFAPFSNEPIVSVAPPDPAVLGSAAVQSTEDSIVKIVGDAPSCDKQIEGSGFVFAPDHVMTNAHVVGGVSHPTVQVRGLGHMYHARVVLFDPERDIAVLDVPGLDERSLSFDYSGRAGSPAVVAGFPENGPFTPRAARIREQIDAQGQDIYQKQTVDRSVFSLYAVVQQGNSGGPLLTSTGKVYGVVFAKSLENNDTGYALTASEVASDARQGSNAETPVGTDGCAI
jgi:S1-C subfamily serine protease